MMMGILIGTLQKLCAALVTGIFMCLIQLIELHFLGQVKMPPAPGVTSVHEAVYKTSCSANSRRLAMSSTSLDQQGSGIARTKCSLLLRDLIWAFGD